MTQVRDKAADQAAFEAMINLPNLVTSARVQANWLPDGRFWFAEGAPTDTRINVFDPATKSVTALFDVARVRAGLEATIGRPAPYAGLPFAQFHFDAGGEAVFTFEAQTYRLDTASYAVALVPGPGPIEQYMKSDPASRSQPNMMQRPNVFPDAGPTPETMSPDGRRFAGLKDGDIYIRSVSDGRYDRLTSDAEPRHGWDVESTRLGMSSAGSLMYLTVNPWSPDGHRLYATRYDERGTRPHHRIRYLRHFDEVEEQVVARAGDAIPDAQPFVFDVLSGARVKLDIDARDAFVILLGWSPAGDAIHLCRISRDMKRAEVLTADPATGATRVLFSETADTFLRIQHEVIGGRSGCTVLPNGLGFLWESERDGWKHLYHYGLEGDLVRQLTSGEVVVGEVLGFDPVGGWIYVSGGFDPAQPYDAHIARVPLAGGPLERLTREPGMHEPQFAPGFGYFVDTVQGPDRAPQSQVIGSDGAVWHTFPPTDISPAIAAGWTAPEAFVVKAADGTTDLHGLMFKPRDFDPAQSYPVVEYLYAGPQITAVNRSFMHARPSWMYSHQALAQRGYIVVVLDARGTPRRSKAFQDVVYGDWRRKVTADHAAAIRNLAATRSWMDLERVGLWGHSWGGYFTIANMLDNPDLYRAGVASAPGCDPYGMFIYEPYIGGVPSPATKAAYDDAVLYKDAARLEGALLIAAGSNDIGVFHSAVNMARALIDAGKSHEFVLLPNEHHGFGTAAEGHLSKKFLAHFDRYLMRREEISL